MYGALVGKGLKHRKPHIGPVIKLWFPLQDLFLCFPGGTEGLSATTHPGTSRFQPGCLLIRGNRRWPARPGFGAGPDRRTHGESEWQNRQVHHSHRAGPGWPEGIGGAAEEGCRPGPGHAGQNHLRIRLKSDSSLVIETADCCHEAVRFPCRGSEGYPPIRH